MPTTQPLAPLTARTLLNSDHWPRAVILAALAQAPVAVGDLFAAGALQSLGRGHLSKGHIAGLLACHTAPAFLKAASQRAVCDWLLQAIRHTDNDISTRLFGQTTRWVESRPEAGELAHRIANDLPWVLGMLVGFAADGAEAIGGLAVQVGMLALLLEPKVALSLAAAMGVAFALGQVNGKLVAQQRTRTLREDKDGKWEEPHSLFGRARGGYFSNTTIGNDYNFNRWHTEFLDISQLYWGDLITRATITSGVAATSQAVGALLLGGALLSYGNKLWNDGQHEAFLTVFLPLTARATSILAQTHGAMRNGNELTRHVGILRENLSIVQQPAKLQLHKNIKAKQITITDSEGNLYAPDDLKAENLPCDRYTICGANGSGKSTLLAQLKEHFETAGFLWPSVNTLMFDSKKPGSSGQSTTQTVKNDLGSSGQSTKAALLALREDLTQVAYLDIKKVLLDEWDAHLDGTNRAEISVLIDRLVKRGTTVIEITHSEDRER